MPFYVILFLLASASTDAHSLIVSYGSNYTIQCPEKRTNPAVKWFFNNETVTEDFAVTFVGEDKLQVTVVNASYTGLYSCGTDDDEYRSFWLLTEAQRFVGLPTTKEVEAGKVFTVKVHYRIETGDNPIAITQYINNEQRGHKRLTNGSGLAMFTASVNQSSNMYFIATTTSIHGDIRSANVYIKLSGDNIDVTTSPPPTDSPVLVVALAVCIPVMFFFGLCIRVVIMMKILYKRTQQHGDGSDNPREIEEGRQEPCINQEEEGEPTETTDIAEDVRSHDENPNVVSGTSPSIRYPPSLFPDVQRDRVLPPPPANPQPQPSSPAHLEPTPLDVGSRETTPTNSQVNEEETTHSHAVVKELVGPQELKS